MDLGFEPSKSPAINVRLLTATRDGGGLLFTEDSTNQAFIRLKADGRRDVNFHFSTNCYASPSRGQQAAWEDEDGGFLIAGQFSIYPYDSESLLIRLNLDGSIDPRFRRTATDSVGLAVTRQTDGKILIATFNRFSRLLADGTPDGTFGANDSRHDSDRQQLFSAILLLPDGRIVACGNQLRGFKADGTLDPSLPQAFLEGLQGGEYLRRRLAIVGDHLVVSGIVLSPEAPEDFPVRHVLGDRLVSFWLDPARAPKTSFLVVSGQRDPSGSPVVCFPVFYGECGDFAVFPDPADPVEEATATIVRFGEVSDEAAVSYFTRDGTARAGVDYQAQAGSLTFKSGENEKIIRIPLIHQSQSGPGVTFELGLTQPDQGTPVSPPAILVIEHGLGFAPGKLRFKALPDGHVVVRFEMSQFSPSSDVPLPSSVSFELQGSTDLRNWTQVGDLGKASAFGSSTFWTWTDQQASLHESRFYRVLAVVNTAAP